MNFLQKVTAKSLEGKTRGQMEKIIHSTLDSIFKGVFKDNHWKPIQDALKGLGDMGIYPISEKSEYYHRAGEIAGKKWYFVIPFGEKGGWHFIINASFGPSPVGTTDAYDVIYQLNWDGRIQNKEKSTAKVSLVKDPLHDLSLGKRYPLAKRKLSDKDIQDLDKLFHVLNRTQRYTKEWDELAPKINKLLGYECV